MKKKICMVGDFAVGKTSLTQKFVNNVFSDKYLTTVGVKIDTIEIDEVKLVIWDIAGRDVLSPINANYLVGAAGYILVADGKRAETLGSLDQLKITVEEKIGSVPFVVAINKVDDKANWEVSDKDIAQLDKRQWDYRLTSAKQGTDVVELFKILVRKIKAQ